MSARPALDKGVSSVVPAPLESLDRLLRPRSIAMVGASNNPMRIGGLVFANLKRSFDGVLYPVHPSERSVMGIPAMRSVADLPAAVDLAVIAVPAESVPEVLDQAGAKGIGGAVVITSGFAEVGGSGRELQQRVSDTTQRWGIKLIGPNCIGYMNLHDGVMANFALDPSQPLPRSGGAALVSQSGGFGSLIASMAFRAGLRLGWFVSTGNEADCSVARVLRYLVERPEVTVLLSFSEALRDAEVFVATARRALELDKPLVLLKAGRSTAGARAALSHTGSITGNVEVLDAICRQYGVHLVSSMQELLDLGLIFQDGRRVKQRRVGIMTTSGGAGVLLSDHAAQAGLDVPTLPQEEQRALLAEMPTPFYGNLANPVDTTAQATARPEAAGRVIGLLARSPSFDMMAGVTWAQATGMIDAFAEAYRMADKPVAVLSTAYVETLQDAGVPTYLDPLSLSRSLGALAQQSLDRPPVTSEPAMDVRRAKRAEALISSAVGDAVLPPGLAVELLSLYGICHRAEPASALALRGGIRRDPMFGPLVWFTCGAAIDGAVSAEIVLRPPFDEAAVTRALGQYLRGRSADAGDLLSEVQRRSLTAVLLGLGQMAQELRSLAEVTVNPADTALGAVMRIVPNR